MAKQNNYTAILTKASDYRDNDKLIRLFTVESGIITAVMRGVKKAGAKLKFGSLPFAFCEYAITESKGYSIVTGCTQIEDLFDLTKDYDSFLYSSVILEAADNAAYGQANTELFTLLLRTLKDILCENTAPMLACGVFLSKLLIGAGFIAVTHTPPESLLCLNDIKRLIRKVEESYNTTLNSARLL